MSTFREIVRRLDGAQKSGHGVPVYTRYVNRWLGRRLAAAAYLRGLTPNGVTWLSLACSAAAIALLVALTPGVLGAVSVAFLLCLGYALDSADGQLARLRGAGGPAGEWLDHVADAARMPAIHLAVLAYMIRFVETTWMLIIPMVFLVATTGRFMGQILAEQLRRNHVSVTAAPDDSETRAASRRAWMQLPSDTGVICLAFVLSAWPMAFVTVYGALALANVALAAASWRRRYRELRVLTPGGDS